MVLKAVLFGFNGIVINDDTIRQTLTNQLLLDENLRPDEDDYAQMCIGRSDRACLKGLLAQRGRTINEDSLDKMLSKKSAGYQTWLSELDQLPLYPGLDDLIFRCRAANVKMAIVTGAQRSQVVSVLEQADIAKYFSIVVAGDDVSSNGSKPAPDGYLQAIAQLNRTYPDLGLQADECIAIEDSFAGIESAKNAAVPVVGVAHVYPNHMLQRRATWVVDYLREIKLDWIGEKFGGALVDIDQDTDTGTNTGSEAETAAALEEASDTEEASGPTDA